MSKDEAAKLAEEEEQREEQLKDLLEPSYPLLKEFKEACPGTYKHSLAVMAMTESVSLELGLDVNFMKVAAQYHDVGKMHNPDYFSENQLDNENPHDSLDPLTSYHILTRHVADSVTILLKYPEFPRELIEVISQHHGNSVLKYFFDKSPSTDNNEYRYKCSSPKSTEGAVLMICDHVEAVSKSNYQAGNFDPMQVIDSTFTKLLDDGQLDEVTMKLGNFKLIKKALAKELEGSYQKRVSYVDDPIKEEDKKGTDDAKE